MYEIKYHPNANPGIDMGFPNHEHGNPWNDEAFIRYENFKWRYSGEWWEGATSFKLFMAAAPFLLMVIVHYMTFYWEKRNIKYRKGHGAHIADKEIVS